MQTRRLFEGLIGLLTVGKMAELGRQLVLSTDSKFAEEMGKKSGADPKTLQSWAPGYIAFDSVISVTGILGIIQGMRKNRKGAGEAALVQSYATMLYGLFYLFYSLFALKGASTGNKLINVFASLAHSGAGFLVYRFSQKALK
ncbi:MAG TPA: hypothetical protein VH186_27855 [Chloroflexia bacterium]|nr:hypothetical protein [Chloroflexia bacterium]